MRVKAARVGKKCGCDLIGPGPAREIGVCGLMVNSSNRPLSCQNARKVDSVKWRRCRNLTKSLRKICSTRDRRVKTLLLVPMQDDC